jgi:hypothetical protein
MTDRNSRRKSAPAPLFGRHAVTRNDTRRGGSTRWMAAVMVIVAATGAFYWSAQRQEEPPEANIPALPEPAKSDEFAALPPTTVPPAETPPVNLVVAPPSEEVDTHRRLPNCLRTAFRRCRPARVTSQTDRRRWRRPSLRSRRETSRRHCRSSIHLPRPKRLRPCPFPIRSKRSPKGIAARWCGCRSLPTSSR